jgi:hypothetical protein
MMKKYLLNVAIALDQLCAAILGYDPDETLSSVAGKRKGLAEKIINTIFFFEPNHCENSIEEDEGKNSIR